jgi:hypothetical protein
VKAYKSKHLLSAPCTLATLPDDGWEALTSFYRLLTNPLYKVDGIEQLKKDEPTREAWYRPFIPLDNE